MKKIFSCMILSFFLFSMQKKNVLAEEQENNREKYFIVTAYYSPLPNQEYYMRGDFEKEKILQGNGTHGASGKYVFSGMLAGPKKYDFGTKIYLEGLGVGVVEDRGQAIVQKGERGYKYDRLDVWMGYGDEGLKRTLAWGKRTVKGEVIDDGSKVTINYKEHEAPDSAVAHLKSNKKEKDIFDLYLGKDSDTENIKKLQEFFKEIGLYSGEIDGIYNKEVISIVYNFQLKNGIIKDETDIGAGYWGEKTKNLFKKKYQSGEYFSEKNDEKTISKKSIENSTKDIFGDFENTKEDIENLEKIFKELGYYSGEITGDFKNLQKIILDFQLKENIISSVKDIGAGNYGPKTKSLLKNKYEIYQDELVELEKKKTELKEKYKIIETEAKVLAKGKIKNLNSIKKGDESQEVRELQMILADLGYFNEKPTAIFGEKTFNSIVKFQIDKELIASEKSDLAGIVGEATISKLGDSIAENYKNQKLADQNITANELKIIFD
ncbi:hypothetical protein D8B46_07845 [Candidatus Gracilibacteria bacterium]|nr:MAG: hypothetical protein D8B46_07845 [Candidatus Gracilibacteria bacterium]